MDFKRVDVRFSLGLGLSILIAHAAWCCTYSDGSGTEEDPYQIATPADLRDLMTVYSEWEHHFILVNDIDMANEEPFTQLPGDHPFNGVLDGNGKRIGNLVIDCPEQNYVGLFGYVGSNGQIRNLGLENVSVSGHSLVGGICGSGVGKISQCYVTGHVQVSGHIGGGICGANGGMIESCYSNCMVSGLEYTGGLIGVNQGGKIYYCYAKGLVTGQYFAGGLAGERSSAFFGSIVSCFWNIQSSEQAGSMGGKGLTSEQMRTMRIFQNAGWAEKGWVMADGVDAPRLAWEGTDGMPIPPAEPVPLNGEGTINSPYEIHTPDEFALLSWYSDILNKPIRIMADLDLSGIQLYPIGDLGMFTGLLDGNRHVIANAVIDQPDSFGVGIVSQMGSGGVITRIGIENVAITGGYKTGGLCGYNWGGAIYDSYVTGSVSGDTYVGGLCGFTDNIQSTSATTCSIGGCYTNCQVTGENFVGGLCGGNGGGITTSYAVGAVTGHYNVGGFCGYLPYGFIHQCYAACSITVSNVPGEGIGGFYGSNLNGQLSGCFWDTEVSGINDPEQGSGHDTDGVIGLPTDQLVGSHVYEQAGWIFADFPITIPAWRAMADSYPRLIWEELEGYATMPALIHLDLESALRQLAAQDYALKTVHFAYSGSVPDALVINQQPAPGVVFLPGDVEVEIWVTKGQKYSGGTGSQDDPYRIGRIGDYYELIANESDWNQNFIITADLDFMGLSVSAIHWAGVLEGGGHVCQNLQSFNGLFLNNSGAIRNLGVKNARIDSESTTAGILVNENAGTIDNCYVQGSITGQSVAGLAGSNLGQISNCYAAGTVTGDNASGLVSDNSCEIINSYAAVIVTGSNTQLGLANGECRNCFYDMEISGVPDDGRGMGLTTGQMQTPATFTEAGWDSVGGGDVVGSWSFSTGDYPRLAWQEYPLQLMPDVRGKTEAQARAILADLGMVVGQTFTTYEPELEPGLATGLEPQTGTLVYSHLMPVHVVVARNRKYAGGSGTPDDPYLIDNPGDWLDLMRTPEDSDKHFILASDLDFAGLHFQSICFSGDLDGGSHILKHTYGSRGIFFENYGEIRNLGLNNIHITDKGNSYIPAILVNDNYGKLESCYVDGSITGGWVSGLAGQNYGRICNCYVTGEVKGDFALGLVGENSGYIENCFTAARIQGGQYSHGLTDGECRNCFYDMEISGVPDDGRGMGLTTRQMQTPATFTEAGWDSVGGGDVVGSWSFSTGDYPRLAWQEYPLQLMPDVRGKTEAQARAILTDLGMAVGQTFTTYEPELEPGLAAGLEPQTGTLVYSHLMTGHVVVARNRKYAGGSGTYNDPYLMDNPGDWLDLTRTPDDEDKQFFLTSDLDFAGLHLKPIVFSGLLDGGGHVLKHAYGSYAICYRNRGLIRNLGLENINIAQTDYFESVGILVIRNYGAIENCFVAGTITGGWVSGLAGQNYGRIRNCYVSGEVKGDFALGLVGENSGYIENCFAAARIQGGQYSHGLTDGECSNCFYDMEISGVPDDGRGMGLTTGQMQTPATFITAGWDSVGGGDVVGSWSFSTGDYPRLAWQEYPLQLMPDVRGKTEAQARAILTDLGMAVGQTFTTYEPELEPGLAAGLEPQTGTLVVYSHLMTMHVVVARNRKYAGGSGTPDDPYFIDNPGDWLDLARTPEDQDKQFILTSDLDFTGLAYQGLNFSGVLEGNGHVLNHIHYDMSILGVNWGTIRNVGLESVKVVSGEPYSGMLARGNAGLIENVYVQGYIYNNRYSAGLVHGNVGNIRNCYAIGTIEAGNIACGLVNNNHGTIQNCYAVTNLKANQCFGLAYENEYLDQVSGCFWNKEIAGTTESAFGLGVATEQMQDIYGYLSKGWDFVGETDNGANDIWRMPCHQPGYPILAWQRDIPGDIAGGPTVDMHDFDLLSRNWLEDDRFYHGGALSQMDGIVDGVELAEMAEHWLAVHNDLIPDPMVSFWTFDQDARDSQAVNDGELMNGARVAVGDGEAVRGAGALRLDGVDDVVYCRDHLYYYPGALLSVSLWFRADSISSDNTMHLIGRRDQSDHIWSLQLWGAHSGHLSGFVGGENSYALTETSFTPEPGRWYHVAMTYDDLGDRKVRLYVDGVDLGFIQQSAVSGGRLTSESIPITIGDRTGGGRPFAGNIDDVRIYRRILTPAEISSLVNP